MFCLAKVDKNSKLTLIDDEIKNFKDKKIYFLHNELRLNDQIIDKYKNLKNFKYFSFSNIDDKKKIKTEITKIFTELKSNELVILDLNLKYLREVFSYLEENDPEYRADNSKSWLSQST